MTIEGNTFLIKSGNSSFQNRQKAIFDLLVTEERNVNLQNDQQEAMEVDVVNRRLAKKCRKRTRALRGQESIFKVPGSPPPRKRSTPDYRRNPHRWTKYTLADVSAADMSEATNTATALEFLNSMQRSAEPEPENDNKPLKFTSSKERRQFRPRTSETITEQDEAEATVSRVGFGDVCDPIEEPAPPPPPKASYINGKLTMSEYVVGEKVLKAKKKSNKIETSGKELRLSHLLEYEDE